MAINIPETCGEVECAVRGRLTSGVTECGEFSSVGSYSCLLDFSDWRLAEEWEVVALKRVSDGLSLLGQPFFTMSA